ncbi:MAG TPA: hypothetical protein VGW12_10075 [Pyrinomonadaceae bacterium]|nr:hypothetical protein [Pyrinomonadaceae bacterium]
MISLTDFQANFPRGAKVPYLLTRLLEYQNEAGDFYSGYFELTAYGADDVIAWFDGDKVAASQFAPFGQGPDGSSYCYWLYGGRKLEQSPVVFLGSEGVDNTVLADTTEEFLSLLAVGYDELGFPYRQVEETENLLRFRAWLKHEFGISPPENADALIAGAKVKHPDLEAWVEDWQKKHFAG